MVLMSLALVIGAFLLVSKTGASEDVEKQEVFKFKIMSDEGDMETIEIDDLEVGEIRDLWTESGTHVLVTREEDQLKLEMEGKEIVIPMADEHLMLIHKGEGEHHNMRKIIMVGEGDEARVHTGSGLVWVGEKGTLTEIDEGDGEVRVFMKRIGNEDCGEGDCDIHMEVEAHGDCDGEVIVEETEDTEVDEEGRTIIRHKIIRKCLQEVEEDE